MPSLGSAYRLPPTPPASPMLRLLEIEQELETSEANEQARQGRFHAWQACWQATRQKLHEQLEKLDSQLHRLIGTEPSPRLKLIVEEEPNESESTPSRDVMPFGKR